MCLYAHFKSVAGKFQHWIVQKTWESRLCSLSLRTSSVALLPTVPLNVKCETSGGVDAGGLKWMFPYSNRAYMRIGCGRRMLSKPQTEN